MGVNPWDLDNQGYPSLPSVDFSQPSGFVGPAAPAPTALPLDQTTPEQQALYAALLKQQQARDVANTPPAPQQQAPAPMPQQSTHQMAPSPKGAAPAKTGGASKPVPMASKSDYDALMEQLQQKGAASLQKQEQGLGGLQDQIKMALDNRNVQLDLSPLMALTDSWTGSNLTKGYGRPDYRADNETVSKLQDAIQKGRQNLTSNEIDLLKNQVSAQAHHDEMLQRAADRKAQMAQTAAYHEILRQDQKDRKATELLNHAQTGFEKDPVVQEANKRLAEVGSAREQLNAAKTNPAAFNELPIVMARLAVSGRLNETELKAFGGSKKVTDQLDQIATSMKDGTLSETNFKYLNDIVDHLEGNASKTLENRLGQHAAHYSTISGKPLDQAAQEIGGNVYKPAKPSMPNAGDVVDGYKFKGGNPADPNAWEKQ